MNLDLRGLIPATVLPMTPDASIDEDGLRRYIRHVAQAAPTALAINVDTGEGPHLWPKERLRVLEIVVDEVGDRIPVVAGLGAQFTAQAVDFAREFKAAGASGLLVFPISAYQGRPLDPEIPVRYHAAIGDATGLPLILFNLQPALGGVNFTAETLERLCRVSQVVAIKEASFDAKLFVDIRAAVKSARPECVFLTGNDNFIYESFVLGAEGALIGFGAVATRQQVELIEHALAGRHAEARRIMDRLTPLVDAIFAAPVRNYRARAKAALVMQGILERETVRPPLLPITDAERERIRTAMVHAGELEPATKLRVKA
ncbi:MAG TPA: dihydrodipicolinate synthase family protein [Candidatus Dormibacteraeota bacterium]|nr:dihydrodipicolinate synthase family protein [Candidatus Dormibacteraeota bacterium]